MAGGSLGAAEGRHSTAVNGTGAPSLKNGAFLMATMETAPARTDGLHVEDIVEADARLPGQAAATAIRHRWPRELRAKAAVAALRVWERGWRREEGENREGG